MKIIVCRIAGLSLVDWRAYRCDRSAAEWGEHTTEMAGVIGNRPFTSGTVVLDLRAMRFGFLPATISDKP
ncbi:hypothetical protein [Chitinivorax sp. B]|uniref:hypothetical protein n=1 Tax=Chitinivorax sp. B TaxID=2502235 RepID=UPI0010F9ED17|nr:hypothetical protein [Chitinivorax sp. B]